MSLNHILESSALNIYDLYCNELTCNKINVNNRTGNYSPTVSATVGTNLDATGASATANFTLVGDIVHIDGVASFPNGTSGTGIDLGFNITLPSGLPAIVAAQNVNGICNVLDFANPATNPAYGNGICSVQDALSVDFINYDIRGAARVGNSADVHRASFSFSYIADI